MGGRRWVRVKVTSDIGEWDQQVVGVTVRTPGYQPGDEVVVMPAGHADGLLKVLEFYRRGCLRGCPCVGCEVAARLSETGGGG